MKIMGTLLTAVLFLLFGMAVPAYSQQDQRDEGKPPQQEEPKPAHPDRAAPPERKETHPPVQGQQRPQEERRVEPAPPRQRPDDARRAQDEQQKQERDQSRHTQEPVQREQQKQMERRNQDHRVGERRHVRIPDERFHAVFGREHRFRIERPVIIEGAPRFQYSGYWLELTQPWPAQWVYTDEFYVDYIDGDYYMFDPRYPGMRILVFVIE